MVTSLLITFVLVIQQTILSEPPKKVDVNFVIIAGCAADEAFLKIVDLHGKVLSIYEQSDRAGSCEKYRADATGLAKYQEMELQTGMRHGFIYRPMTEWIEPAISWASGL